jgi:hypothetical protein
MSRTFRRKAERHEYYWVLRDSDQRALGHWVLLAPRSKGGRKAIARFHSDAMVTMRASAPRAYRKAFDRRVNTRNDRMLRRWLNDPRFDPVFQAWHKHVAN